MQKVIIVGNGDCADMVYNYLSSDNRYTVVGFTVGAEFIIHTTKFNLPVVPIEKVRGVFPVTEHKVLTAIGYNNLNKTRESVVHQIKTLGYQAITYIHKNSLVFSESIGTGSVILAGAVVEPGATIGESTFVWSNCTVAHNVNIGNYCWIAAGSVIAGNSKIGNNTFLGVNATVANNLTIAEYNLVGAHTAILKSTQPDQVFLSKHGELLKYPALQYAKFFLN